MTSSASFASASVPRAAGVLTLPRLFGFDALTCVALGTALVAFTAPLSGLLGLPPALLFWAGLVLFPSAAAMLLAAWRPSGVFAWLVVGGNVAWVVASVAVLVLATPTAIGGAFLVAQAAAVAVLAWLEWSLR